MKMIFDRFFKLVGFLFLLSTITACCFDPDVRAYYSAPLGLCASGDIPIWLTFRPASLRPTPETEAFVRNYQATLGARTAANEVTPLMVEYRIGPASDPNVCINGYKYGPYTVTGNTVEGDQTASADEPTLQLVNAGDIAMCTIITSPVNATLSASMDKIYMDNDECTEKPADILGIWQGAYSCTAEPANMCEIDEGVVTLNILQDEYSASYRDGAASYKGHVCGNRFEYSGGGPGYTESGTFILKSDGTANKTSHYEDDDGVCSGDCSDPLLQRISQQALLDHFDDNLLDGAWVLGADNTLNGLDGWTYSETISSLTATDVTPETIHTENGQTYSRLKLLQQLPVSLSDFIVEFDIEWTSDDNTAMQYLRVDLYPEIGDLIAYAGYSDAWVGSAGRKDAMIWASHYSSPLTLPDNGSARIMIARAGESTSVHWDGVEIHSGYSFDSLNQIYLIFAHYPFDNGDVASSFGSLSVDRIRVSGLVVD